MDQPGQGRGPQQVFFSWTAGTTQLGRWLADFKAAHSGSATYVQLERGQGGAPVFQRVLGDIEESQLVVAFLDKPNVHVGFEVGLAFGLGIPVVLARHWETSEISWVSDIPLGRSDIRTINEHDSLLRAISDHDGYRVPEAGQRAPDDPGIAVLCPARGHGSGFRNALTASTTDAKTSTAGSAVGRSWTMVPAVGSRGSTVQTEADLARVLGQRGRLVWTITVGDHDLQSALHNPQNAANAFLAGWFYGQARRWEREVLGEGCSPGPDLEDRFLVLVQEGIPLDGHMFGFARTFDGQEGYCKLAAEFHGRKVRPVGTERRDAPWGQATPAQVLRPSPAESGGVSSKPARPAPRPDAPEPRDAAHLPLRGRRDTSPSRPVVIRMRMFRTSCGAEHDLVGELCGTAEAGGPKRGSAPPQGADGLFKVLGPVDLCRFEDLRQPDEIDPFGADGASRWRTAAAIKLRHVTLGKGPTTAADLIGWFRAQPVLAAIFLQLDPSDGASGAPVDLELALRILDSLGSLAPAVQAGGAGPGAQVFVGFGSWDLVVFLGDDRFSVLKRVEEIRRPIHRLPNGVGLRFADSLTLPMVRYDKVWEAAHEEGVTLGRVRPYVLLGCHPGAEAEVGAVLGAYVANRPVEFNGPLGGDGDALPVLDEPPACQVAVEDVVGSDDLLVSFRPGIEASDLLRFLYQLRRQAGGIGLHSTTTMLVPRFRRSPWARDTDPPRPAEPLHADVIVQEIARTLRHLQEAAADDGEAIPLFRRLFAQLAGVCFSAGPARNLDLLLAFRTLVAGLRDTFESTEPNGGSLARERLDRRRWRDAHVEAEELLRHAARRRVMPSGAFHAGMLSIGAVDILGHHRVYRAAAAVTAELYRVASAELIAEDGFRPLGATWSGTVVFADSEGPRVKVGNIVVFSRRSREHPLGQDGWLRVSRDLSAVIVRRLVEAAVQRTAKLEPSAGSLEARVVGLFRPQGAADARDFVERCLQLWFDGRHFHAVRTPDDLDKFVRLTWLGWRGSSKVPIAVSEYLGRTFCAAEALASELGILDSQSYFHDRGGFRATVDRRLERWADVVAGTSDEAGDLVGAWRQDEHQRQATALACAAHLRDTLASAAFLYDEHKSRLDRLRDRFASSPDSVDQAGWLIDDRLALLHERPPEGAFRFLREVAARVLVRPKREELEPADVAAIEASLVVTLSGLYPARDQEIRDLLSRAQAPIPVPAGRG